MQKLWLFVVLLLVSLGSVKAIGNNYTVIGYSEVDLTFPPSCFQRECSIGLFVADAILNVSAVDIAIVNGGFIRAGILRGEITANMIDNVCMWNDLLYILNLTGQELDVALENGVSNIDTYCPNTYDGRLAQVAGIEYSVDCTRPVGSRVTISRARLNGVMQAWSPTAVYRLAANDFMVLTGGDGYTVFTNKNAVRFMASRDIVEQYITSLPNRTITEAPRGRMFGLESCVPPSCANFNASNLPTALPYHPDVVRSVETRLGDFIANSMTKLCYGAPCDISIIEPAFITAGIDVGVVTESELIAIVANATARPFFVEAKFSTIKAFLEAGPDFVDIACSRQGIFSVAGATMDMDCTLGSGLQINNFAIRGIYYKSDTADNWYQVIAIESVATQLENMGGRNLQPYAIDMRTFLEEYAHLAEYGSVDLNRLGSGRINRIGGGCTPATCSSNPPFTIPPVIIPEPVAPTRPCTSSVIENAFYDLEKLSGRGPYNAFNGRYNITWDICNPLPTACGASCAAGTAAVCVFDTSPPTEYVCVPFFGGKPQKYAPTNNGGANAPNATVGVAFVFGDGEVTGAKINLFCDATVMSKPNQEYIFEVPPRVEVQIMHNSGCPKAVPPAYAPMLPPSTGPSSQAANGLSADGIAIAIFVPLIVIFIVVFIILAVIIYRRRYSPISTQAQDEDPNL